MIGFFDSGFGGLTVLRRVVEALPQYDYLYLGDNARAPYGSRSQKVVYEFTREAVAVPLPPGLPAHHHRLQYLIRQGPATHPAGISARHATPTVASWALYVRWSRRWPTGDLPSRGSAGYRGGRRLGGLPERDPEAQPVHPGISESLPAARAHHRGRGAALGRSRNDRAPLSRGTHGRGRFNRCPAAGLHPLPDPLRYDPAQCPRSMSRSWNKGPLWRRS